VQCCFLIDDILLQCRDVHDQVSKLPEIVNLLLIWAAQYWGSDPQICGVHL